MPRPDRQILLRLASSLPVGSPQRRAILGALQKMPSSQVNPPKVSAKTASTWRVAFSEANFWAFVESGGWGKKTTDYNAIKQDFMERLDARGADEMRRIFSRKTDELAKALREYEADTGEELDAWGDSYDDLMAHIVGLGLREFRKHIQNPQLIIKRYNDGKYRESFAYALPFASDFKPERQGPQSGNLFQKDDKVYLQDLPSSMAQGYRAAAKKMEAAALASVAAYEEAARLKTEAAHHRGAAAKVHGAIKEYIRRNSPEGLDEYDLSYIPDIERHGFLKRDATPREQAQHYVEQAQAVLKSK